MKRNPDQHTCRKRTGKGITQNDSSADAFEQDKQTIQAILQDHDSRILRVCAGPGSGKTELIAAKIAAILKEGADPEDILCLTFTRRACRELNERIAEKTKGLNLPVKRVLRLTHTFHAYAAALIRESGHRNNPEIRAIMDGRKGEQQLLEKILSENSYDRTIRAAVHAADSGMIPSDHRRLSKRFLFIDEAQDMKLVMYELVCSLLYANRQVNDGAGLRLFLVYDKDQAIFGYNKAYPGFIAKLTKFDPQFSPSDLDRHRKTRPDIRPAYTLICNHRSTSQLTDYYEHYRQTVLHHSEASKKMQIRGQLPGTGRIRCYRTTTENIPQALIHTLEKDIPCVQEKGITQIGVIFGRRTDAENVLSYLQDHYQDCRNIAIEPPAISDRTRESDLTLDQITIDHLDEFHQLLALLWESVRVYNRLGYKGHNVDIYPNADQLEKQNEEFYSPILASNNNIRLRCHVLKRLEEIRKYDTAYSQAVIDFTQDYIKEYCRNGLLNYDDFKEELSLWSLQAFCRHYIKSSPGGSKKPSDSGSSKIRITVSTIHQAKGLGFDRVYLACPQGSVSDINKCRYVAITRAAKELHIFNPEVEEGYCETFDMDLSSIKKEIRFPAASSLVTQPCELLPNFFRWTDDWRASLSRAYYAAPEEPDTPSFFPASAPELSSGQMITGLRCDVSQKGKPYYTLYIHSVDSDYHIEQLDRMLMGSEKNPGRLRRFLKQHGIEIRTDAGIQDLPGVRIRIHAVLILEDVDAPWKEDPNASYALDQKSVFAEKWKLDASLDRYRRTMIIPEFLYEPQSDPA